ncbi:MAG: aspartate aminotransferase family protein, partial [Eubacteriales bacterium]|nr:aspartate aminotransferase family protein [Eubacteriales bacterium]
EAKTTGFQAPIAVDRGRGAIIYDADDNKFIDWTSGVLVTNIGHCHPKLVEKLAESTSKILNCYEYPTEYRVRAAEGLIASTPKHLDTCFFLTTGGEATDAMMRIMKRKTGMHEIISFYGGFHGRLYSSASAGGLSKVKKKFGPTMPGIIRSPFPYCYRCPFRMKPESCHHLCLEFLDDVVRTNSCGEIAGLITEPYLGTGGFIFPPEGWMKSLEKWIREKGILFALDEVQSAFGRGGKMWFMEWEGLTPDIACAGKGIGSGIAQSALVATSDIMSCLGRGELSSTAGGNPIACAATIAVLDVLKKEKLIERSRKVGEVMLDRLMKAMQKATHVGDVRGRGLVIGIEIVEDKEGKSPAPELCKKIVLECANKGLLVGIVGIYGNVIRVAPPLVITDSEVEESLCIMEEVLTAL